MGFVSSHFFQCMLKITLRIRALMPLLLFSGRLVFSEMVITSKLQHSLTAEQCLRLQKLLVSLLLKQTSHF